jgi:hypothetical protein
MFVVVFVVVGVSCVGPIAGVVAADRRTPILGCAGKFV